MNTIGVGQQYNNATIGGEIRNCLAPGGETNNTKDIWIKNKNAKPIGEDLRAFASKIKSEAKETAGEIGSAVTGSENKSMNCLIGAVVLIAGCALHAPVATAIGAVALGTGLVQPMRAIFDSKYEPSNGEAAAFL